MSLVFRNAGGKTTMDIAEGEDGLPVIATKDLLIAGVHDVDAWRKQTAVLRMDPFRVIALRASDISQLSCDQRLLQVPGDRFVQAAGIPQGRVQAFLTNVMLMTNGAEHQRLRGAFTKTFAHPVIRRKREEVRAVADHIVADLPRGEDFDFLKLCASRLPAEVIASVLGLPVEKSSWFANHVYTFSRCLSLPYDIEHHDDIEAAAEALYNFAGQALDDRRASPRDDLLSSLARDESARALEPEVLTYQVMGLILAGSDTTRAAFNMAVGRLLSDRDLWEKVKADRSLIPAAIEEALRLEPPVGTLPRYVAAPIEIGGLTVAAGQVMGLSTLSAMRDENNHAMPESFDLFRTDHVRPHPVFGGGAHRCLGEMLARIELEEGLSALMDAAPDIALVSAPQMEGVNGIRRSTPLIARIG